MDKDITELENDLLDATSSLLNMARQSCCNRISENCLFIISEIKENLKNFHEESKSTIADNNKKKPLALKKLLPEILTLYPDIYDLNLLIHKSLKSVTIVDIRYYHKKNLEAGHKNTVIENIPMLHCKIAMPPYQTDKSQKFDINWQHKTFLFKWRMFWFGITVKKEFRKRQKISSQ